VAEPNFQNEFFGIGDSDDSFSGQLIGDVDAIVAEMESGILVLEERACSEYRILSLSGETQSGSVSAVVKINGTAVTGLNGVAMDATQDTHTATAGNRVVPGDKLTIVLTPTSAVNWSWTLACKG